MLSRGSAPFCATCVWGDDDGVGDLTAHRLAEVLEHSWFCVELIEDTRGGGG